MDTHVCIYAEGGRLIVQGAPLAPHMYIEGKSLCGQGVVRTEVYALSFPFGDIGEAILRCFFL